MPIKWENSKYSLKARKFLSKKPEDFPLLTLLDGAVRSGKTLNIVQKIPQIFDKTDFAFSFVSLCLIPKNKLKGK